MTPLSWRALRALIARALAAGATRHSLVMTEWNCAGNCTAPRTVEYYARPAIHQGYVYSPGGAHPLGLIMHVRCRRCEPCLRVRRREWILRAVREIQLADRTWLVTLTMRPEEHYRLLARAVSAGADVSTPELKYSAELREAGKEVTRYLKRLRKASGSRFRYLLVPEQHRSGLPHYHMLLHETAGSVKYATITAEWYLGFTHAKLVQDHSVSRYVAKYLMKCSDARVRASLSYGGRSEP